MEGLHLRSYVVWIPMLGRDELASVPQAARLVHVSPQYFDGAQRVGHAAAHGANRTVWDAYLFFPPDAVWPSVDAMPAPEAALAQIGGIVAGTENTLPAIADQSELPADLAGELHVVGAQSDIVDLLRRTADTYAARHRPQ